MIERDLREREQLLPEPTRVQAREVAFDEALALEATDALDAGRQRQVHGARELRDGEPAVGLQQRQELPIDAVQLAAGFLHAEPGRG